MEKSAGIIPYRYFDGRVQYFLAHPYGAKNYWAFMKGRLEEGEDTLKAAIREFKEESGLDIEISPKELRYLGTVRQRKDKLVSAYAWNFGKIKPEECHSNLIEDSDKPENDDFKWMTIEEVREKTHKTHITFYEQIEETYGKIDI